MTTCSINANIANSVFDVIVVSLISTICGVLGMMNVAGDTIGLVGSMLMIIVPNSIYIITEGSIDKESVKNQ